VRERLGNKGGLMNLLFFVDHFLLLSFLVYVIISEHFGAGYKCILFLSHSDFYIRTSWVHKNVN
jgi:hypothetical protein